MKTMSATLIGLLALSAVPAQAQTSPYRQDVGGGPLPMGIELTYPDDPRKRYEEIEILGRLFDRALGKIAAPHGQLHGMAFSPDGRRLASTDATGMVRLWDVTTGKAVANPHHVVEMGSLQGHYLRGHGLVYTGMMPLPTRPVVAQTPKEDPKRSDWEDARRELRGERVDRTQTREDANISIADTLLKVMAENGHRLKLLPDGESLTVALTLGASQDCARCHDAGQWHRLDLRSNSIRSYDMDKSASTETSAPRKPLVTGNNSAAAGGTAGAAKDLRATAREEAQKAVMLGDLHVKQGQTAQAAELYRKALEVLHKIENPASDWEMEIMELTVKWSRLMVALGKKDEATEALKRVAERVERFTKSRVQAKSAKESEEIPLASRLILRVPKKVLDQMGTGKMTYEDFRKSSTIEHLSFEKKTEGALPKP